MKIIEAKTAPNARRVRMFLAEKNLLNTVTFEQVDIQAGANLSPEYRKKNITTKVPVLELDGGECIGESVAICRYFEALNPEPSLMGKTPFEQASIEMWQRRAEFHLMLPVGMCFQHTTGYFKDRMLPVPAYGEECGREALRFMGLLDEHLATSQFLAGESFSIADITALCAIDFARVVKLRMADEWVHLKRWHGDVSARPSAAV
ncbi:glutathione S-transferase family protein [Simiduia aestuariiviva]|uniref:Glutathione S-transferase n=1 Tax=Simiduia aestuariiviva TaxID=1510459 RepID=A0A839UQ03_9GAMM|nr:glutathione S-transferase [Simiduia aestuariiviva]MBB3168580.1 glutathione S-transferase [Simiduia aestuariiviva]